MSRKRILGGFLWFLTASYSWAFFSAATGIFAAAALPIGILVGAFVIADPLGFVWSRGRAAAPTHSTSATTSTPAKAPAHAAAGELKA